MLKDLEAGDKFTIAPTEDLIEKAAALIMLTIVMSDYKNDESKRYNKEDAIFDLLELIQKRINEGVSVGII